ncbi:hypothetical protein KCU90_g1948, partial [Aureobasidium melanogenum]
MHRSAVIGDEYAGALDQRAEFAERERAAEIVQLRAHAWRGGADHGFDQRPLARATGNQQRRAGFTDEARGDFAEPLGRIAARSGCGPRMQHDPADFSIDAACNELRLQRAALGIRNAKAHARILRMRADMADEIELPLHLMAGALLRFRFAQPVGQQRVGILAAMREAARNAGEVAKHGGGQRALTVDRENHRGIETAATQALLHAMVVEQTARIARGLRDPRRVVLDHVVDVVEKGRERDTAARRQQSDMTIGRRVAQRMQRGRGHQDVAEIVESHTQNSPDVLAPPRGRRRIGYPCMRERSVFVRIAPARDQRCCLVQIDRARRRHAVLPVEPLGLVTVVEQHRAATRAVAGLDVVENIADEPAAREVEPVFMRRAQQHAWCGLPATAQGRIARDAAAWVVRAPVHATQGRAAPGKQTMQFGFDPTQRGNVKFAQRDAGLIADNE